MWPKLMFDVAYNFGILSGKFDTEETFCRRRTEFWSAVVFLIGLGMWLVWGRRGGRIGSWWGNRRGRDRWGDLGVDGWIILGWISRMLVVGMGTGLG
jgi:hypothetical protein